MAICISIVVGKGGAGKTTTCVNLASAMAMDGNKVLVVDTDTQANTTMFLTSYKLNEKAFGGKGLFDMIRAWGLIDVENYIHPTQIEGIDVIVSNDATPLIPQQLETLEKVAGIKAEEFLLHALSEVAENYDYILIDTPPAQNDVLVQNALLASDHVIIPVKLDEQCIDALKLSDGLRMQLEKDYDTEINLLGILPTMVERTALTSYYLDLAFVNKDREENPAAEELAIPYADKLFRTYIHKGNVINESSLYKKPALLINKKAKPCVDYVNLWAEIKERMGV
ncbi:MAG: ParA family protein [Oscillospiraceae bacterium]|nr:ParA family protein [Oscillospiraceae bacterium]